MCFRRFYPVFRPTKRYTMDLQLIIPAGGKSSSNHLERFWQPSGRPYPVQEGVWNMH